MLIGTYLKNFKCYQGTQFVPCFSSSSNLIGYLGDNGVGKSAVLEALDAYFSKNPHWNRNKESKKGAQDCFVAPVFMVDRKIVGADADKIPPATIDEIESLHVPGDSIVLCVAKREDGTLVFFDGKREVKKPQKLANSIYQIITKHFQYVYINSEVDIDEEAKINSKIYELIIGSSIVKEVEKKFLEVDRSNKLVENLNSILATLVDDKFTNNLNKIDTNYTYGGSRGSRSKLTNNVLAHKSTEIFLASRKLQYKGKQLNNLSSGQRRSALMDFIMATLDDSTIKRDNNLIIAFDEPEISLDASKRLSQFEKLSSISEKRISVLFTSHWYGWIPVTKIGDAVLIEENETNRREIKCYKNESFPFQDMPKYEMRMIFDFLMSLGAAAEANKSNKFIICEGVSDQILIAASLKQDTYKILPVGKKRVKKIADIFKDYFWKDSGKIMQNVIFLIDTDPQNKDNFENPYLKRWCKGDDLTVGLSSGNANFHNKCTIENILEPDIFLLSLKSIYKENEFIQNLEIKHSELSGTDAFGMDNLENITFNDIAGEQKINFATKYADYMVKHNKTKNRLGSLIESCFNS